MPGVVMPELYHARGETQPLNRSAMLFHSVVSIPRTIVYVKRYPIEQAVVTLHHLVRDIVEAARHCVNVELLVGHLLSHRGPLTLGGLFIEPLRHVAPSVHIEHDL